MTKVVNKHFEEYDIYIGRGSKWGNPYTHIKDKKTKAEFIVDTREESLEKYEEYLRKRPDLLNSLSELKDKRIACFCVPHNPCHGHIIIKLMKEMGIETNDDFWEDEE